MADFVRLHSARDAVVVTYQDIEDRFDGPGIRTVHFNAIAGLDTFGEVRSLFVIGRPMIDPRDLRDMALADRPPGPPPRALFVMVRLLDSRLPGGSP